MDFGVTEQRSRIMSSIRSRNTQPEMIVRQMLKDNRIRGYKLQYKVYGNPDIALPKERVAIFVDGCFWHGCKSCYRKPVHNSDYWAAKHLRNQLRDLTVNRNLRAMGYKVMRIKEHDVTKHKERVLRRLTRLRASLVAI